MYCKKEEDKYSHIKDPVYMLAEAKGKMMREEQDDTIQCIIEHGQNYKKKEEICQRKNGSKK